MPNIHTMNRRGHPLAIAPLEQHQFQGSDFLCVKCGRPRALHEHSDFRPSPAPDRVCMDGTVQYRTRRQREEGK